MKEDKKIYESKKAIALAVSLLNINFILVMVAFKSTIPLEISQQAIQAVLALTGIYLGAQGGQDMIISNRKKEEVTPTK
jgi:hypothetical protein